MYYIERTDKEIDKVLNLADDQEEKGGTAYPGVSYEQGVSAGIRWACNMGDPDPPLP